MIIFYRSSNSGSNYQKQMELCNNQSKYVSGWLCQLPVLLLIHMMAFFVLSSGVMEHDVLLKKAPSHIKSIYYDPYDDSFILKSKTHAVEVTKYDANFQLEVMEHAGEVEDIDQHVVVESSDGENLADCFIVKELVDNRLRTALFSVTRDLDIQEEAEHIFDYGYNVMAKAAPKGLGHLLLVITTEVEPHYSQYLIIDPFSNSVVHSEDLGPFIPIQDIGSMLVDETVRKVWLLGYKGSSVVILEAKYETGNDIILPSFLIQIYRFNDHPVNPFENCWTLSLHASHDASNPDILTVVDHKNERLVQYYFDHPGGTDERYLKEKKSIPIGLNERGLKDITGVRLHGNYLAVRKGDLITIYTVDLSKHHLETKEIMHRKFGNDNAEGWVESMEFSKGGKSLIGIFQMQGNHYGYRVSIRTESDS